MSRLTVLAAVVMVAGATASAQHLNTRNPVRPMPPPANALPYGNILFPGGISHAQRVGGQISGSMPYTGVPPRGTWARPQGPYRNRTVVVPYAVPVYGGGYYGYSDYGYGQQAPTNVTVVVPQQPTPSVVINQHYTPQQSGEPVMRDYSNVELPQTGLRVYEGSSATATVPEAKKPIETQAQTAPTVKLARDDRPTIFLIAMKDTTIRQAIGYWVEDSTLHYVTPKGTVNHVTLDMVDKETSVQLNAERKLELDLNPPKR